MTYMEYIEDEIIEQNSRYEDEWDYINTEWQAHLDEIEEEEL
jgi:hypothetical protein